MKQVEFIQKRDQWLEKTSNLCHEIAIKDDNYPDFYVFQSEIFYSPDLLIIAANPHGDATYRKKMEEKKIEKRTKDNLSSGENMYIANPNWNIAKPVLKMFENPRLFDILKNSVIMNAIYFNTNKVTALKKYTHGKEMIEVCQNLTNEFVYEILKPKNILFLGDDAPKWMKIKYNYLDNAVLRNEKGLWLIQKAIVKDIPHYKIHHTSRNYNFNSGINLELKKKYFEEIIF